MSFSGERTLDLLCDAAGALALAVGLYCFDEPAGIAPGGVSGLALLVRQLAGLPVGLTTFALNIPILLYAFRRLGRDFVRKSLRTLVICTLVLDGLAAPFFPQYAGDRMLGSIFGGVCTGAGLGVIFLRGSTTAGTDIISCLIERRFPHVQLGAALMAVDCLVLGLSILVFRNLEAGLFGLIALFCQARVIDALVYGADRGKQVLVMSPRCGEIAARVIRELDRTATLLKSRGAYSGQERDALLCVVRAPEYHTLKTIVHELDPNAFLIVTTAEQVAGEGFRPRAGR